MDFINNSVLKKAVLIACMNGMRKGEITYLKWSDVDFGDEKYISGPHRNIKQSLGKSGPSPLQNNLLKS